MFLAHAPADAASVREIRDFLDAGCDGLSVAGDGATGPGRDLLATAELGRSADILILALSPASNPARWIRQTWEPLLLGDGAADQTNTAVFLLQGCTFPALLRRGSRFFDATSGGLSAMRRLKRWLLGTRSGTCPAMTFSPDLEILYRSLDDQAGTYSARGPEAERFARQSAPDFEAVLWIPGHGRTVAQIAGEIGAQSGMALDGPVEENCRKIRRMLTQRRCLLILDAPEVDLTPLLPSGRTSVLFTSEPVQRIAGETSLAAARSLLAANRFAEAYEMLYRLLNSGVQTEACARELVWICERWDRQDEANTLRFHFGPAPSEQLRLF